MPREPVRASDPGLVRDPAAAEPTWDVAQLFPRQGMWTEGDYFAINTNHLVELSAGMLEVPEMPTDRHQAIVAWLFSRLLEFVSSRRSEERRVGKEGRAA